MRILFLQYVVIATAFALTACAPKIGSEAWCKNMEAKAKGDWTINEVTDYAKHCILRNES